VAVGGHRGARAGLGVSMRTFVVGRVRAGRAVGGKAVVGTAVGVVVSSRVGGSRGRRVGAYSQADNSI